jgi:DNA (cytosine-5)-methyltransferase 3A
LSQLNRKRNNKTAKSTAFTVVLFRFIKEKSTMLKFLIGGSPCTTFSIAQTKNREVQTGGPGWDLFMNFVTAKEKFKPTHFLYENNKSTAKPIKAAISEALGVPLQHINAALVSAQNRERFYAHNFGDVPLPEDRGILLEDILESGVSFREKSYCLDAHYWKGGNLSSFEKQSGKRLMVAEPVTSLVRVGTIERHNSVHSSHDSKAYRVYSSHGKSVTLCGNAGGGGAKVGLYACPVKAKQEPQCGGLCPTAGGLPINTTKEGKAQCIRSTSYKDGIRNLIANNVDRRTCVAVPVEANTEGKQVYEVKDGRIEIKGKTYPIRLADGFYMIRKLSVVEASRCMTLPDDYCRAVSASQALKGLGNGWVASVIIHLLSYALAGVPKDTPIEVLSMYDGIGTGRYCFDALGYHNIRYFATEIDKYAMAVSHSNYPDIVQIGDAFQVRDSDWKLPL